MKARRRVMSGGGGGEEEDEEAPEITQLLDRKKEKFG